MNNQTPIRPVRRRCVFYIPGYDPFHPRRYRELYRKEAAAQAALLGYEIALRPRGGQGAYGWDVSAVTDGAETETEIEVLVWHDIVKNSMSTSITATYVQLVSTAWRYIASGALACLMRLRKGPVIAALYPVVFLLGQLLIALGLGWGVGRAAGAVLSAAGLSTAAPFAMGLLPVVAYGVLRWFQAHDRRVFAYYLMHDYAHSAQLSGAYPPELEARLAEFKTRIAAALREDVDEVLVVGHSSGAYLGVTVLADLIRDGVPAGGPALSYLSLGQVVPMVSFLPRADRLRGDLQFLSESDALTWVDVTAPGDGCSFALCDPVAVTGVARAGQKWPIVISAAFTQTLSPERWAELRWRFFRLHFQYLCSFDRPGDYDYFQITGGPLTLGDRFKDRAHSRSRKVDALSKYTSVRVQ
ncbi:hypothetical protein TRM7557_03714 [Tritonibacter multivorans]|uniref:Uncharacterized protein n=1 Tax=Tritonibacter multivorans TaxID=928856 RepID=A0A0P1H315_9RHOB|nr:hypothetical protein [Tritonibacter multivorans]MDA7421638.1 hypothetical protein [Tritonibacter multivorans]CUH82030.1 hypothetical protein TRM7557_03714 [Tritonibacter multivorans]SFC93081.1 hypothetical protein SAMN04488049_10558 [Tritonibacter multivorans]